MTRTSKNRWEISARDKTDLFSKFGSLGISVPDRSKPKDQFAEEMYCPRRYLFPLVDNVLLEFPVTATKGESPDFLLTRRCMTVGLEITKATQQEFEADLTRFDRGHETKNYASDPAVGTMDLSFAGWGGNAAELELVEYILARIANKLEDIDSYSVGACDLLIYDNTPTPALDLKMVADAVHAKLFASPLRSNNGRPFGVVSVIRDPWLIYDIGGAPRLLAYKPAWGVP